MATCIDVLLNKGRVELKGLIKDQMIPAVRRVINDNKDWILGAYIFETRKEDGFHLDSTSIYIVEHGATFRPDCSEKYGDAAAVYLPENRDEFRSLKTLGVAPMKEEEYQKLHEMNLV